ncbi:hypothetical protein SAMN05660405_02668 [Psychrobacter pacificensis]|uniref:Uncharacterized protein n=1 Tax=Psychrobacter pacificensis TaxID=112002 RepID=A0A1G7B2G4_9GAMM|nr:hypothetical protein GCM10007915_12200 [Psychrobacter pacificensis]SDE20435.1 hypothetical protein SAMN05660405_02668 [Psychrobacter pacificensis]
MDVIEIIKSNVPLDWVTLPQFAKLIGLPHTRLYIAKEKWPEGKVWKRVDNKIYFSLNGWNEWLDQQGIQKASEYETTASKLISQSKEKGAGTSSSRTRRRRKTLPKRENYELV